MFALLLAGTIGSVVLIVLGLAGDAIDRHERTREAPMARFGPSTRPFGRGR